MEYLILVIAILICAYRAMRAARLINVTIWLAVTSALVSVLIYILGAPEVAVIELSVGSGLVTVLFVFSFSITGDTTSDEKSLVPHVLVWALVVAVVALLSWLLLPTKELASLASEPNFGTTLWRWRGLDVVVQMVLIFAGVMGLLGLLSTSGPISQNIQLPILSSQEDEQSLSEVANIDVPGTDQ